MKAAQQHIPNAQLNAQESSVRQHVPYVRHVSETTLRTREGYYLQVIEVPGISFETDDQEHLDRLKDYRAALWKAVSSNQLAIYTHISR